MNTKTDESHGAVAGQVEQSVMQHTRGPWRVWECEGSQWWICEPNNPRRHSYFASVQVGNMWHDEGKANARLIAAAPQQHDALMAVRLAPGFAGLDDATRNAVLAALAAVGAA